jgi:hypothetical protein
MMPSPDAAALAWLLLTDMLEAERSGVPRKYRTSVEQLAQGERLLDLLLPTGKTLGQSTFGECEAVAEAWKLVAAQLAVRRA